MTTLNIYQPSIVSLYSVSLKIYKVMHQMVVVEGFITVSIELTFYLPTL